MTHFYRDVPDLGNVVVSRHAQDKARAEMISQVAFERALLAPIKPDTPDGMDVVWRERDGVRIVVLLKPTPFMGAALVKTVYRVGEQARAHK